jgi:hypothetical protein
MIKQIMMRKMTADRQYEGLGTPFDIMDHQESMFNSILRRPYQLVFIIVSAPETWFQ